MLSESIRAIHAFNPGIFIMHTRIALLAATAVLAACATRTPERTPERPAERSSRVERGAMPAEALSSAGTVDAYKYDLAQHINAANASRVYSSRPQALLRSVVVLRYAVDARGHLVHSEIVRSNRDSETEATALASLRNAAPFPKPAAHLLRRGKLEVSETWLFNNDGRFQLRTTALPQMAE
jgi:protein TonB